MSSDSVQNFVDPNGNIQDSACASLTVKLMLSSGAYVRLTNPSYITHLAAVFNCLAGKKERMCLTTSGKFPANTTADKDETSSLLFAELPTRPPVISAILSVLITWSISLTRREMICLFIFLLLRRKNHATLLHGIFLLKIFHFLL